MDDQHSRWGRLTFTRPFEPAAVAGPTGAFAGGFRPEFTDFMRAQYARTIAQAQGFVEFVGPSAGSVVIEVGAGSGRITFDGGLAARVGPSGQVLMTDPNTAQLAAAAQRARDAGMVWVKALRAPAEDLPLASDQADLVLGAYFIHFTTPQRALASMARVARPGGQIALSTLLQHAWPPAWMEILGPVIRELGAHGLPFRPHLPDRDGLLELLGRCGLTVERVQVASGDIVDFPSDALAVASLRQLSLVPLLLRGVPEARHPGVAEAVERQVAAVFPQASLEDRRLYIDVMDVVARRP